MCESFIKQEIPEPYFGSGQENAPQTKPNGLRKYAFVAILCAIVLSAAFFAYVSFSDSNKELTEIPNNEPSENISAENLSTAGNGWCDASENCFDNLSECPCPDGEYCSSETKLCVKPSCENNRCEYFETPDNCPIDCGCYDGYIFNSEKKICEAMEFNLSDEEVKALISGYFTSKGSTVTAIELVNLTSTWKNEVGINAMVYIDNKTEFKAMLVLQNKTVIDTGY
jgi:hypothetical protein